jgi:hypothetical protein
MMKDSSQVLKTAFESVRQSKRRKSWRRDIRAAVIAEPFASRIAVKKLPEACGATAPSAPARER